MRLTHYFDELDLEMVIPKLLTYVFDQKICENAIWLTAAQFKLMKLQELGVYEGEIEQYTLRHLRLQAFKPLDEVLIAPHVHNFAPDVSMSTVFFGANNKADLLCPILDVKSREAIAYILLTDVLANKVERLRSGLDRDLGIMARHISYSMK